MTDLLDITIGLLLALSLVLAAIGIPAAVIAMTVDMAMTRRERRVRR